MVYFFIVVILCFLNKIRREIGGIWIGEMCVVFDYLGVVVGGFLSLVLLEIECFFRYGFDVLFSLLLVFF